MKRYRLAFLFLIGAVIIATIAFLGSYSWLMRSVAYVVSIGLAVYATLLYSNAALDKMALKTPSLPEVQLPAFNVPESIQDDLEALQKGRVTSTHFMAVISALTMFSTLYAFGYWNKWGATWGGFSVILVALAVSAIGVFLVTNTGWFQDQDFYTPFWVFLIPVGAIVLCLWLGIYFTEPMELGGLTAHQATTQKTAQAQPYDYTRTRAHSYFFSSPSVSSGSSSGFSAPSCSGKGCNGYLVIILIALALVLVVCSALIPHFWVLACIMLFTAMVLITLHDLRVIEPQYGRFSRARW